MFVDDLVGQRQQQSLIALPAFHPWFVADAKLPFVAAGRCITGCALGRFPAQRIHIRAPPEQAAKECDLLPGCQVNRSGSVHRGRWNGLARGRLFLFDAMLLQQRLEAGILLAEPPQHLRVIVPFRFRQGRTPPSDPPYHPQHPNPSYVHLAIPPTGVPPGQPAVWGPEYGSPSTPGRTCVSGR